MKKEEIDIFKKYTNYNLENKYAIYADHNMYNDKYIPNMIYYGHIITDNYTKKSKKELFPLIDNCDILNCIIPLYKINDSNSSYYIDISGDSNEIFINNLNRCSGMIKFLFFFIYKSLTPPRPPRHIIVKL